MQGLRRRIVYVTLYEAIAIAGSTAGLAAMSGHPVGESSGLAVATSAVAVAWNLAFNHLFEAWERHQTVKGRSVLRRICHAIGFEGGLIVALVPLIAWWFGISLWQALVMDVALMVFFLVYTFVFNWGFDRVFGLPASAQGGAPLPS
jgi:uncharacterized membrane protein